MKIIYWMQLRSENLMKYNWKQEEKNEILNEFQPGYRAITYLMYLAGKQEFRKILVINGLMISVLNVFSRV